MLNSSDDKYTVSEKLTAQWEPESYMKFLYYRTRPARELIHHIHLHEPKQVVDLGCGPGHLTQLMAKKWPRAHFTGIDSSWPMLEKARENQDERFSWLHADLHSWRPEQKIDLVFANSFFHLIEHRDYLPELFSYMNSGGVVAIQMPVCRNTAWYQLMLDVLKMRNEQGIVFGDNYLLSNVERNYVMGKEYYYSVMKKYCSDLNIWDTEYLQALDGDNPVFEWVSAAGLKPVVTHLAKNTVSDFIRIYQERLLDLYPKETDGTTLFPFKRRFIIATVK